MMLEIKIYEGTELLFEHRLPEGQITEARLEELIRALVAKHGLSDDEIVAAHLKRNVRGYTPFLEVRQDRGATRAGRFQLLCGEGVHAVVRITEE